MIVLHSFYVHHSSIILRPHLNIKTIYLGIGIPIIKMRWSSDCLIIIMRVPILVKTVSLYWDCPQILWLPKLQIWLPLHVAYLHRGFATQSSHNSAQSLMQFSPHVSTLQSVPHHSSYFLWTGYVAIVRASQVLYPPLITLTSKAHTGMKASLRRNW